MQKLITVILFNFILATLFGQMARKVSTYLLAEYNNTIYDYTAGNNPWGTGLGLQSFYNTRGKFKPVIEFTADFYLEDDKVLRSNPDGSFPKNDNSFGGMINLFAGSSFHPSQNIYVSLLAGPCFIGGQTLLGIKPSLGFYFSENKKWMAKVSYINIFNRAKIAKADFGSLSLAIGLKLF